MPSARSLLASTLALLVSAGLSGCTLIQKVAELPITAVRSVANGFESTNTYDPVDLQENLLRYADNFISSTGLAMESLKQGGQPINREFLVMGKVRFMSDILAVVGGANSLSDLVGMVLYTESIHYSLHAYWKPAQFGDSTDPLIRAVNINREEIRRIAQEILTQNQLTELDRQVEQWHRENVINQMGLAEAASMQLVNQVIQKGENTKSSDTNSTSVFTLLDLDPLASLDPAKRELTETRLFGERALFLGQHMPQLMEWQMELLAIRSSRLKEIQSFIDSADRLADAAQAAGKTVESFPSVISSERQKVLDALKSQETTLNLLAAQFGKTFDQGGQMAAAAERALTVYSQILTQIQNEPKDPGEGPKTAFRIQDYGDAAERIGAMSQQLNALLTSIETAQSGVPLEALSRASDTVAGTAENHASAFLQRALLQLLAFLALAGTLFAALFLTSALIYRRWILKLPA